MDYKVGDIVEDQKKRYFCYVKDWCNTHPSHDPQTGTQAWTQLKVGEVLDTSQDNYIPAFNYVKDSTVKMFGYLYTCLVTGWCNLEHYSPVGVNGLAAWSKGNKIVSDPTCSSQQKVLF